MTWGYGANWMGGASNGVLSFISWALIITLLVALIRLIWKKGDKVK